jgi:hypothetical protein
MRDFNLVVPSDCSVSQLEEDNENALKQMEKVLKADIRSWREINLKALKAGEDESRDGAGSTDKKTKSQSATSARR